MRPETNLKGNHSNGDEDREKEEGDEDDKGKKSRQ